MPHDPDTINVAKPEAYAPWWFAAQEKHGTGIPYSSTQTPPPPVARLQAVEDELK